MKKTKYALVLSGGGFKGAFQLGALNYLKEHWHVINPEKPMHFDIIAGISVGSLNGALLAMNKMDQLNQLWDEVGNNGVEEIYTSFIIDTENQTSDLKIKVDTRALCQKLLPGYRLKIGFKEVWQIIFKRDKFISEQLKKLGAVLKESLPHCKSIADNGPLFDKLKNLVSISEFGSSDYSCGFVSLDEGKYFSKSPDDFLNDNDLALAILASTAMPIVWDPIVEINFKNGYSRNNVDGGIQNVSPLGDVIKRINEDPDEDVHYLVFIVNCSSGKLDTASYDRANIGQIALRALNEIAITEIFNNDIDQFLRINDIMRQLRDYNFDQPIYNYKYQDGARSDARLRFFETILIQPDPGKLGNTLVANRELVDSRLEHGRLKAEKAINEFGRQGDVDCRQIICV